MQATRIAPNLKLRLVRLARDLEEAVTAMLSPRLYAMLNCLLPEEAIGAMQPPAWLGGNETAFEVSET